MADVVVTLGGGTAIKTAQAAVRGVKKARWCACVLTAAAVLQTCGRFCVPDRQQASTCSVLAVQAPE